MSKPTSVMQKLVYQPTSLPYHEMLEDFLLPDGSCYHVESGMLSDAITSYDPDDLPTDSWLSALRKLIAEAGDCGLDLVRG